MERPRIEHHREAFGIGLAAPRLSFVVASAPAGWRQAAYEIEVADEAGGVFRSGRIESPDNVQVPWPAPALASRERRLVRARAWGAEGGPSAWSPAASVEAGLLARDDWQARFVAPDWDIDPGVEQPAPLLRRGFTLADAAVSARLYVTALGVYDVEINGSRVGDHALAPGWTSYPRRLRYQTFDVGRLLRPGENVIGAWLGEGWYAGRLGFAGGHRCVYGERVALLAQLEVTYANGATEAVVTDTGWRAQQGPIMRSGIYDGEGYDARRELPGWSAPGFDDCTWSPVRAVDWSLDTLVAPLGPPVRCTEELPVASVVACEAGRVILDFGQNLVGRCRIQVCGPAGTAVTIRHAEVLQGGELCTRPLREARATDEYILRGEGVEVWEPRFTFHGFRYAEVSGWPGAFDPACVTARVYHTDMARTGWFECSDERVNQLHRNVVWSMRGNFLDLPTDCPQRDERLGWTGDIQVFGPTASFLYNCAGLLGSWLEDVAAEQLPDGNVPFFVPRIPSTKWEPPRPTAVWGDAAVLLPWALYEHFGDAGVLARQYESARAYVDLVARSAGPGLVWDSGFQLGDWLDPAAPPDDPAAARSDRYLVATAYFARSARVLALTAAVLGLDDDARRYADLADGVAAAFRGRYLLPSGRLADDAQASYALALRFELIPEGPQRLAAARRLAELVAENGFRIGTGFAGTPVICDALSANGALGTAYALLLNEDCPSWLYSVAEGATTIWERWDSLLPDGTVNPGEMTSFNHYALGAVAGWLHRTVAGLAPAAPGHRQLRIQPRPGGGLTHAAARLDTPYGRAEVSWRLADGQLVVEALVPVGATALVDLPGVSPFEIDFGRHRFEVGGPQGV